MRQRREAGARKRGVDGSEEREDSGKRAQAVGQRHRSESDAAQAHPQTSEPKNICMLRGARQERDAGDYLHFESAEAAQGMREGCMGF
ncbi:hypothetical protein TGME49_275755 [Toxoplasma gondii ME49]|uniref:Uncharacterized protein n=1 Tax=Toxoplasma gondii (strain ATCC 50611 / Me49) TaxID=508771 RepID=S8FDW3_TOXGM|nr:hypothetical protein TGME49_275755 [Toxoplasma gondii ME49]EPT31908.1 hypothetical protein TGME49_275755 [Toxoplasma gondii ME49]|eukprot:XP_018638232.1 hypothetical protein TGME49_275755 [Toxoplasma gondii ME49]